MIKLGEVFSVRGIAQENDTTMNPSNFVANKIYYTAIEDAKVQKTSVRLQDSVPSELGKISSVRIPESLREKAGIEFGSQADILVEIPDPYEENFRGIVEPKVIAAKKPEGPAWLFDDDVLVANCD